jgi:hypothetical protein
MARETNFKGQGKLGADFARGGFVSNLARGFVRSRGLAWGSFASFPFAFSMVLPPLPPLTFLFWGLETKAMCVHVKTGTYPGPGIDQPPTKHLRLLVIVVVIPGGALPAKTSYVRSVGNRDPRSLSFLAL